MNTDESTITLEEVVELLDKKYNLVWVEHDSNFNENLKAVAKAIRNQDWSFLDEAYDDWIMEAQDYGIHYAFEELKDNIIRSFDVDEEKADEILELFYDEIRDIICDRDCSTPISDMIKNTSDPVMFYDTGLEINYDIPFGTEKELKECVKEIKKALKIKLMNTKWDDDIAMMVQQGYHGRFVIYFNADINEMMNLSGKNMMKISNPAVAIISTWNGSGDHTFINGHEFSIPFNIDNFFIDKEVKYSYTYDVCGMSSMWCDGTIIKFYKGKSKTNPAKTNIEISKENELEEKYNKVYKAGGCSFGDMTMRRHRDLYYINDFPCGTKCKKCSTFWID